MKYLDMHDILVNAQHGFRKSQIIMTVHDLANSPNRNEPVDGICFSTSVKHSTKCHIKGYWKSSAIIKFVDICTVELRIS